MIEQAYREYCETLWRDWLEERLEMSLDGFRIQSEFAPEPYLRFGAGKSPLFVLFTNPGGGFTDTEGKQVQKRDQIQTGKSCVTPLLTYHEAALQYAKYYLEWIQPKNPAFRRNKALHDLMEKVDADCIVQFESLPYHSSRLPNKTKLSSLIEHADRRLREYVTHLKYALSNISVVGLSAVDTSKSISVKSIADSPWLNWQAKYLLGIDPSELSITPLVQNGSGKTTSAFLHQRINNCIRGIVLMMGSNNFPGETGLQRLADTLNYRV